MSTESGYHPIGSEGLPEAPWNKVETLETYECAGCYNRVSDPHSFCKDCHDSAVECGTEV